MAYFIVALLAMLVQSTVCMEGGRKFTDADSEMKYPTIVVYGSTGAGAMAAISASKVLPVGSSITLVDPSLRLGGMMTGGLSHTDVGLTFAIGGLANDFFLLNARQYNASASVPQYDLEPHVAEALLYAMLESSSIAIIRGFVTSVSMSGSTLTSLHTQDGRTINGTMFIDATYEGDLMRLSGASFTYGREANTTYGEQWAGRRNPFSHPFDFQPISPYADNGSLLPLITDATAAPLGSGDDKVQDYNFRLCALYKEMNESNWIPFPAPEAPYNASQWELLRRLAAVLPPTLTHFLSLGGTARADKFDVNNGCLVSTDAVGLQWTYPSASYSERAAITEAHKQYMLGYMYALQNDPGIPSSLRAEASSLGLCADEWVSNGHWPEQLYVREALRLVGDTVFVQNMPFGEAGPQAWGNASIGLGSYPADGHYAHRGPCLPSTDNTTCAMVEAGSAELAQAMEAGARIWTGGEGYVGVTSNPQLYQLPYFLLTPKADEVTNLLCPTTPSASHVTFASIRMEPQFMILGQAAGAAAALASVHGTAVQSVNVDELHGVLTAQGAVLCHNGYPNC